MTKNKLEQRVQYLEDYISICKLQSTYCQYLFYGARSKIHELFAKKTPGVEVEIGQRGVFKGSDAPQRYFEIGGKTPGWMIIHLAVNPVIDINKDGTSAKAEWLSPGLASVQIEGKLTAIWAWGRYNTECVKEGGEWKFLKFRWGQVFMTPYDKGWVEASIDDPAAKVYKPDLPSTPGFYAPYRTDTVNVFEPPSGLG